MFWLRTFRKCVPSAEDLRVKQARKNLDSWERELEERGASVQMLRFKAVSLKKLGRTEDAQHAIQQACELCEAKEKQLAAKYGQDAASEVETLQLADIRLQHAEILVEARAFVEARYLCDLVLEIAPSSDAWKLKSSILMQIGSFKEACLAIDEAIRLYDPRYNLLSRDAKDSFVSAFEQVASLERRGRHLPKGMKWLVIFVPDRRHLLDHREELWQQKGRILQQWRDFFPELHALSAFNKIIKGKASEFSDKVKWPCEVYVDICRLHISDGKLEEAYKILRKAARLAVKRWRVYRDWRSVLDCEALTHELAQACVQWARKHPGYRRARWAYKVAAYLGTA